MNNETLQKQDWQTPEIVDLDVDKTAKTPSTYEGTVLAPS